MKPSSLLFLSLIRYFPVFIGTIIVSLSIEELIEYRMNGLSRIKEECFVIPPPPIFLFLIAVSINFSLLFRYFV